MILKSYFGSSVQSVMATARRAHGDEIALVTSRPAPVKSRHLGEIEVVFAVEEEPVQRSLAEPQSSTDGFELGSSGGERSSNVPDAVLRVHPDTTPASESALRFQELFERAATNRRKEKPEPPDGMNDVRLAVARLALDEQVKESLVALVAGMVSASGRPIPRVEPRPRVEAEAVFTRRIEGGAEIYDSAVRSINRALRTFPVSRPAPVSLPLEQSTPAMQQVHAAASAQRSEVIPAGAGQTVEPPSFLSGSPKAPRKERDDERNGDRGSSGRFSFSFGRAARSSRG